jgi:hypothetical protein
MKKTDMAKSSAKKLMGKMNAPGTPGFGNATEATVDRREQRKLDQALGLVPFAIKLNSTLILNLEAAAKERGLDLNAFVAELLSNGLANKGAA